MKTQEVILLIDEKVSKATTLHETAQMNLLTAIFYVMFLKFKPHAVFKHIHVAFVSDFPFSKRANIPCETETFLK